MRHSISLALQTIIFFGVVLPMRAQEGRTLPWQREIPLHGLPETSQPDAVTRYSIVGKRDKTFRIAKPMRKVSWTKRFAAEGATGGGRVKRI